MAEINSAQELALREQSGDASAAVVPTDRISTVHPYNPGEAVRRLTGELYYFFPHNQLWVPSAHGFGQIRGAVIANATTCYQNMIEHVFFVANLIGEEQTVHEGTGLPHQLVTWTVVPSANDENKSAGFLVRVMYQHDIANTYTVIEKHMEMCKKLEEEARFHNKQSFFTSQTPAHRRLTRDAYMSMCNYYLSKDLSEKNGNDRSIGFGPLSDEENPYNPLKVFSLANAVKLMKRWDAHADFTSRRRYLSAEQSVSFPRDGAHTYKLAASQLNYTRINKIYMPHSPRGSADDETEEYRSFARNAGVSIEDDDGDDNDSEASGAEDGGDRRQRVMNNYNRLASSGDSESSNTLLAFKRRVAKRMASARAEAAGDPARLAVNLRDAKVECIRWFLTDILTVDATADVGDALHAIAKWKDEHLAIYKNFMMPNEKDSLNLSRYGDLQAQDAALCESVWAINTAHSEIKSIRLSCMHVYYYSPFHAHVCLLGPPGAGKSNAFGVNDRRLIEGSSRDIGVETAKAKMTPGKKTDLSIETNEDIPPTQVGVVPGSGGVTGSTGNTDQEAILKNRLTKGSMLGCYKMVVNGVHSLVEIKSFCNTVMLMGMNAELRDIPKSVASRFNVLMFQLRNRTGFSGQETCMFQKHELAADRNMNPLKQTLIRRSRRNQLFHAIIQLLCWAGVFANPDMTVPVLIWSHALNKAQKKGLHDTSDVRNFERLKFHCETTVVEDAIDRVLDSELSPLDPDADFRAEDILEFEKHLVPSTEHAAFVLGLLQHQYENPVIHAVEKFIRLHLLKNRIAAGEAGLGKPDASPLVQEDNLYYYFAKFDHSLTGNTSSWDRERSMQQIELIKKLAKHVHKHMDPKPGLGEVVHAVDMLVNLNLEVEHKTKAGETRRIPALTFSRDGELMVSEALVKNYAKDRLKACLREVLSHEFTKPKNILYGRTKERCPFVWESLKIFPVKGNKLKMERSAFFSSQLIRYARNAAKGVNRSIRRAPPVEEMQLRDVAEEAFQSLFSDVDHKNVDMDLDDFMAQKQCDKLGLRYLSAVPPIDAPNWSVSADSFKEGCLRKLDDDKLKELPIYPQSIPDLNPKTCHNTIRSDERNNPERFSLKAVFAQSAGSKRKRNEPVEPEYEEERKESDRVRDVEMADAEWVAEDDEDEHLCDPATAFCSDGDVSDGEEEEDENGGSEQEHGISAVAGGSAAAGGGGAARHEWNAFGEHDRVAAARAAPLQRHFMQPMHRQPSFVSDDELLHLAHNGNMPQQQRRVAI